MWIEGIFMVFYQFHICCLIVTVCAILFRCPSDRGQGMVASYYSLCRTMNELCQNILFKLFTTLILDPQFMTRGTAPIMTRNSL